MMTGFPTVTDLNQARSDLSRQGRPPSRPMTPLRARAATSEMGSGMTGVYRATAGASRAVALGPWREALRRSLQTLGCELEAQIEADGEPVND
jgi:hypothetical protein